MTTFVTTRHIEIDENYQGINLTEFVVKDDEQIDSDQLIKAFMQSKQFLFDSLRDCIKAEPNKGYLRRAFHFNLIKIADFKKTDKQGVITFLLDFMHENDWGDDRNDFLKLLDRYFEIHNVLADCDFYIISKDWFSQDNEKVVQPESWVYSYYFLIISVNSVSKSLTISEWTYD